MTNILTNPVFETKINKAVFIQQDLVVRPSTVKRLPDNIDSVIKFLFGEGACLRVEIINGYPVCTIEGACYELRNVRTTNADWTYQEVEE